MKIIFTLGILVFALTLFVNHAHSQTLEFSQARFVSDSQETVPVGKVWKITSIYGQETRVNECVNLSANSTHELRRLNCANVSYSTISRKVTYTIGTFKVNGVNIVSSISGLPSSNSGYYYTSANCTGNTTSQSSADCATQDSDPNLLPIWLPAGTTLESGGPNTFLSVIEFTIQP